MVVTIADLLAMCGQRSDLALDPRLTDILDAVSRDGPRPIALYNLANVSRRHGHMDLWRLAVECAFQLPHHSHQELYERGNAKLLLDDWSGWIDRESRIYDPVINYLESRHIRDIRFNIQAWDGREGIGDRSLLLVSEGTLSDCLRMLRYIPTIASRCGRLTLSVQPEVAQLLRSAYGHLATVTLLGTQGLEYDRYAWMTSLPALTGGLPDLTRLPGVKSATPSESGVGLPLDVGVCWAGDLDCLDLDRRSISLHQLAPLLVREDMRWWSLQTGVAAAEVVVSHRVRTPAAPLHTLAQMAQLTVGLGAVVTVDAAVAHIAAMLEVPTYVLLHAEADARWGLGESTRWYPTVRLIRQDCIGTWDDAVAELSDLLSAHARQIVAV
jgi:hypothetical protein